MGVTVVFNYALWVQTFPEFAAVTQQQAQVYFDLATVAHRNDGGGPVPTASLQTSLLNIMTAHIAQLFKLANGAAESQLVGRISSATEGSVTVQTELPANIPAAAAWFAQTKYGLMYWQMTNGFRTAVYRARPQFVVGRGPLWGR